MNGFEMRSNQLQKESRQVLAKDGEAHRAPLQSRVGVLVVLPWMLDKCPGYSGGLFVGWVA